jgi:replicative DNA helicase
MSDEINSSSATVGQEALVDFEAQLKADRELKIKKAKIEEIKITSQYDTLVRNLDEVKRIENLNVLEIAAKEIDNVIKDNRQFIRGAKKRMGFIDDSLRDISPLFPGNIVVIGAESGRGKSTVSANIAYGLVKQQKKSLIISTEETSASVYRRVACLHLGMDFNRFDELTEEQQEHLEKFIKKVSQYITVITDDTGGNRGLTTSIEGIINLLENIKAAKDGSFDCIMLDYWQGISHSKRNVALLPHEVQIRLSDYFDQLKNVYPAPIVVLSQLHPDGNDDKKKTFEERIKGSKSIYVRATMAIEMRVNFELQLTEFVVHKSRFFPIPNGSKKLGFMRGLLLPYTEEFQQKVRENQLLRRTQAAQKPVSDNKEIPKEEAS